jgi:PKD repeat protein
MSSNIKRIITGVFVVALVAIAGVSLTNTGGAPGGYTNAPNENNCTSCHSGTLQTSGTNYNNISLSGNYTGGGYIPDSTYEITLSYTHTGRSKFGYQLTCLDGNDNMAGSFSTISGNNRSSLTTATINGQTRRYVRQTSSGTSGNGGTSWKFNWTAPSNNVDTVIFYVVVNAANNAQGNAGDIIIAREFKVAPSALLPTATASANSTSVCAGTSISLQGSATNSATSWNWSFPGGTPSASTSQNPSVVYSNGGTYNAILRATNAKGESLPDTVQISVKASPTAFINGNTQRTICKGDSTQLVAVFTPGASYRWSNGETGNIIYAKDTGTYNVVVTNNGCSKLSNSIQINWYAVPQVSLTSNASLLGDSSCTNSTVTLRANPSNYDSFSFYADGQLLATTSNSTYAAAFDSTTIFSVLVQDSNGCVNDTTTYTVDAKEQLEGPEVFCNIITPTSIEFGWSAVTFHDGFEVSTNKGLFWLRPSSGATGTKHLVQNLQPEDSFELWVRGIDKAPCFYSKITRQTCVADTCYDLGATVKYDDRVCFGDLVTVEVNGLKGKNYGLRFDNGSTFTDTIIQFNPSVTSSYSLFIEDSNHLACPAREIKLPMTVDRIFDIALKPAKIGAFCEGETITFTANDTIDRFDFYVNDVLQQSGSNNSFSSTTLNNADEIFVIVEKGACKDTSQTEFVVIEPRANASFTYERSGSVYSFSPFSTTYQSYAWDFGDGSAISNDVEPSHDFSASEGQTVNVNLEVVTENNCVSDSTETILLPNFSTVESLQVLGISLAPNPVDNSLHISVEDGKPYSCDIYNGQGAKVFSGNTSEQSMLDVSDYNAGVYWVVFSLDGKQYTARFVKN